MSNNLRYPTNHVVGIIRDRSGIAHVVDALRELGVDDGRIHILRSAEDDHAVAPHPKGADGPVASLVRGVQKALGDEAARLEQLEEALDAGHDVVSVELAVAADDEDAKDTQKREIGKVLRDAGARDVAFYGTMQIEQLDAGGTT